MELQEAIRRLTAELDTARAQEVELRHQAEERMRAANVAGERVAELERDLQVLGVITERLERPTMVSRAANIASTAASVIQQMVVTREAVKQFEEAGRAQAVEMVMRLIGTPMTPVEMVEQLHKRGRDDDYDAVHSAMLYLKKKGTLMTPERGVYELASPTLQGIPTITVPNFVTVSKPTEEVDSS